MKTRTVIWLKAAGVRAAKTMAQTAVALVPIGVMVTEVDWWMVVSTAVLAGILSVLTSIAGLPEVDEAEALTDCEGK